MPSGKRAQKSHTDEAVLLIGRRKFSTNRKLYLVTRHQYGISALVPQTSFCGEINGGVTKCRRRRLFAQAKKLKLPYAAKGYLNKGKNTNDSNVSLFRDRIENLISLTNIASKLG